jgi:4-carboxymuconolactone decarboxylase
MPLVSVLAILGATDQLVHHLGLATGNGNTETELTQAITDIACYAGWPRAIFAMTVAKAGLPERELRDAGHRVLAE